ncbi:MAG: DUF2334 domain-containing protein [Candidatus Aenigmatarchaeota archaeon]
MALTRRDFLKIGALSILDLAIPFGSSKAATKGDGEMIVEIHHNSPRFYESGFMQRLDESLDKLSLKKREYTIVPVEECVTEDPLVNDFYPISNNSDFLDYVQENYVGKFPIGQHGFNHSPANSEGEFEYSNLNEGEARQLNKAGIEEMLDSLYLRPDRFVPPNWSLSDEAFETALDMYDVLFGRFNIYKKRGNSPLEIHRGNAYSITWDSDSFEEKRELVDGIFSEEPQLFRFVIYPKDVDSEAFEDVLEYTIDQARDNGYEEKFSHDL